MRKDLFVMLAAGAVVSTTSTAWAEEAADTRKCEVSSIQAMAPDDTTIVSATPTAAPVPHCRIEGFVTTTNPGPNKVNFRLQLPDTGWKNRYYFIGMGAAAGYVPSDSQIPPGNPLYKGYAVAGTDTGHQAHMVDWSFLRKNEAQAVDHVHRGAHVVAVATQKITRDYYDAAGMYRYHSGCSGGGRMGVMAIERHPEDFDGVLLGAPGGRSSATMLKFIAAAREMSREPGAWVSPAKFAMVDKKVTAACDGLDGAKDDIIADPRECKFDVAKLACSGADGPECLTQPEIRTIKAILAGPQGPNGKLTEGFPISNMSTWPSFLGQTPPPWSPEPTIENLRKSPSGYVIGDSLARVYFGPDYDALKQFDFKDPKQINAWWEAAKRFDYGQPYPAELGGFSKAGGKLLLWNGVSDSCCSDIELEQYYNDAGKKLPGGKAELEEFVRFYRVPGMAHCGGGTGPQDAPDQMLDALVAWVEQGKVPQSIVTHRGAERVQMQFADPQTKVVSGVMVPPPAGAARDFLLCPHPQVARFNQSTEKGAVDNAANWSCVSPAKKTASHN
ncbi:feruloyl esterase [Sphingomonas laterariae]|uniref:Feruloyl esterase n=1 Tax=Edaphosphingomonas laterariae TaxID=861865 RepID=A0A239J8E6_9SPHN|nr:tannase/feruloyl esterase family alpha/beta hydrolase [Sphingomonas laterariae]SNT01778.1 feruloyl esterase [Sphingomonas laterariae]